MPHRPIPFATPGSSDSAHSPFYQRERRWKGKRISEGIQKAREEREAKADLENSQEDLAEAVVPRRRR